MAILNRFTKFITCIVVMVSMLNYVEPSIIKGYEKTIEIIEENNEIEYYSDWSEIEESIPPREVITMTISIKNNVLDEVIEEKVEEIVLEDTEEIEESLFIPYGNIPLSAELQEYTYNKCLEYDVEFEIILALMYRESSYQIDIISVTNDYGLMQINKCNHTWLKKELEITDFLNAEQNIEAGIYMVSELKGKYGNMNKTLMAYNMGEGAASKLWQEGIYSSKYSESVIRIADYIKNGSFKYN